MRLASKTKVSHGWVVLYDLTLDWMLSIIICCGYGFCAAFLGCDVHAYVPSYVRLIARARSVIERSRGRSGDHKTQARRLAHEGTSCGPMRDRKVASSHHNV